MKVSVLITTHNREAFITQTIDSVLMQEVNFDYEIVVGDDGSTDHTREILVALQKAHPNKIRLLLHEKKLEGAPGKLNFVATLAACEGEYVALLDSDDYWTNIHKLQMQVDFLESHPECAICFHNVLALADDGGLEPKTLCPPDQKEISTLEDLLSRNLIPTCSALFRRGQFDGFPEWYFKVVVVDWPSSPGSTEIEDICFTPGGCSNKVSCAGDSSLVGRLVSCFLVNRRFLDVLKH